MDLIRELKDVRFELALRGYDCDAVDAFLAKVRAEVAELQSQRENAQSRVNALEEQVASGESDTEGTLRRTLILAQRLADETVADARNSSTEMIDSATAEAAEIRATTQAEIEQSVAEAEKRTVNLRAEADAEREEASSTAAQMVAAAKEDAGRTRAIATEHAEQLLVDAERAGAERVVALETTAKEEAARKREPIRAEVEQLESTRSMLQADIGALEEHLSSQRERVKHAVEALRIGMSGSIHDLERLAEDDEVLAVQDRPDLSNASAADVDVAPDVDIVEFVDENAAPAPTVEQMSSAIEEDLETRDVPVVDEEVDPGSDGAAEDTVSQAVDAPPDDVESDDQDLEPTQALPVVDADAAEVLEASAEDGGTIDDEGGVNGAGLAVAGGEMVDLDAEPSALFETDVAQSTEVIDVESAEAVADPGESAEGDGGFVDSLTEALGSLPIQRSE